MVNLSSQIAIFLFLLLLLTCSLRICEMKAFCNQRDQQILLCFKHGLTDPSNLLSTWSNKEDCCEWSGVQCDNITGRVTDLILPCFTDVPIIYGTNEDKTHCLQGEFHNSLFQLEFLKHLDLRNNNFKSIHSSMDCQNLAPVNTSNLAYLDLSLNENLVISDMRWLLHFPTLKYLYLYFTDLHLETQWLQIIAKLPSLSKLDLSSCLLESVSLSLEHVNFTSIEYLDLSDNDFFSELPKWMFNLSDLSTMILEENRFHGQLPNTLLNLKNLTILDLNFNKLRREIPDWLGQFENLQKLWLEKNLFTGHIPTTLGNLSSLKIFDVSNNQLTDSLPESLGRLSNLIEFYVFQTSLSGLVSHRNFVNLSKLKSLALGSPFLIFDFNHHWVPPFQLVLLRLDYAKLKLIPWLYTQTSLTDLIIKSSSFETISPIKFWSFTNHIYYLYLKYNSMNWDMSSVLLNSTCISLTNNSLRGGVPRLTSTVEFFSISENSLSGPLSPLLCHKMNETSNLEYLDLSSNLLSGGLTDCWANWKSLIHINLGRNNLSGMIPHSMGTLPNIVSMHLHSNSLFGEIFEFLKKRQKLIILDLGGNKFSGRIPNLIGQYVSMKALRLRSNEFTGDIPQEICLLSSLTVLDLANNKLSGTIPHCLNNITNMVFKNASTSDVFGFKVNNNDIYTFILSLSTKGNELYYSQYMRVVDFSSNHLLGEIPLQMVALVALQSLNLSKNQLIGTIPKEIGNMKQLESLDFSDNKLSGEIPQSLSGLSFLEVLNLSFNNLMGQIPLGTQLQSFTSLSYEGNPGLCGTPLTTSCRNDEAPNDDKTIIVNDEKGSEFLEWFYMGIGVGFATGFWVVCGSIFFIRKWRQAYFKFLSALLQLKHSNMIDIVEFCLQL